MAEGEQQMGIMVMVLIAIVAGLYFFTRKGSTSTPPPTAPPLQPSPTQLVGNQSQFTAKNEPQYSSVGVTVDPNTGLPLDPYTITKPQLPIISGSVVSADPYLFTPTSAGMCQCNDQTCCYYSPFQEAHSYQYLPGPETRVCKSVLYGDALKACNDAVTGFGVNYQQELKASYARARVAQDHARHLSTRPAKAAMLERLAVARLARRMGLR